LINFRRGDLSKEKKMSNFSRAHDRWLEPPDEPEAVFCDDCGDEMEEGRLTGELLPCGNVFCPSKFKENSTEREMAIELVDALEENRTLKLKLTRSRREVDALVEQYSNSGLG
jgi:hypothetical protein